MWLLIQVFEAKLPIQCKTRVDIHIYSVLQNKLQCHLFQLVGSILTIIYSQLRWILAIKLSYLRGQNRDFIQCPHLILTSVINLYLILKYLKGWSLHIVNTMHTYMCCKQHGRKIIGLEMWFPASKVSAARGSPSQIINLSWKSNKPKVRITFENLKGISMTNHYIISMCCIQRRLNS